MAERLEDSRAVQKEFRKFKSHPRDPRYFMMGHLEPKFDASAAPARRERRAALILNRFTRTLAVLYATDSLADLLGVSPESIDGKSFYECIHRRDLPDAIKVLESAKANDSIAYLRFQYRDPRSVDEMDDTPSQSSDSDEEGGVRLHQSPTPMPGAYPNDDMDIDMGDAGTHVKQEEMKQEIKEEDDDKNLLRPDYNNSRSNSDRSETTRDRSMFGSQLSRSSTSSAPSSNGQRRINGRRASPPRQEDVEPIMVEAVVSCSSDGMVVIIRRVHPDELNVPQQEPAPNAFAHEAHQQQPERVAQQQSLFAAPWGVQPIVPGYQPEQAIVIGKEFQPHLVALEAHAHATGGPYNPQFMQTIRDVAVFAWAVTGINGNLANHATGTPQGQAVPPHGLPIWDQNAPADSFEPPQNQALAKWTEHHAHLRGGPVPLPFTQQEYDQGQYYRQQRLIQQQYNAPYGPDAPGSSARKHIGKYIGEDGRGPSMLDGNFNMWLQGQDQRAYNDPSNHFPQPHLQPQSGQSQQIHQQHGYGQPQQSCQQTQQYGPPRPPQQEQGYAQQHHYSNPYGPTAPAASQQQQQYAQKYHNAYERAKPAPQQQAYGYGSGNGFDRAPPQHAPPMATGIGTQSAPGFGHTTTASYHAPVAAGPSGSNGFGDSNAFGGSNGHGYGQNTYGSGNASGSGGYPSADPSSSHTASGSGSGSGSRGSGNDSGREGSASSDRYLWY